MKARSKQRGMSLVAAIFLMTVLSALGAFIVTVGSVQSATPVAQLQGARALAAGQSGIEWARWQIRNNLPPLPAAGFCPAGTFTLTQGASAGYLVTVTCARTDHVEGSNLRLYFDITVTATLGAYGTVDFVARTLRAKFAV